MTDVFFCFFQFTVFASLRPSVLLLLFSNVAILTDFYSDEEELVDIGRGIELSRRSMVFVPINDAAGRLSRGSHW